MYINYFHKGLMNQYDLYSIQNNYISLSSMQNITNSLNIENIIGNTVIVEKETSTANYQGRTGIDNIYQSTLNVNDFQIIYDRLQFKSITGIKYFCLNLSFPVPNTLENI